MMFLIGNQLRRLGERHNDHGDPTSVEFMFE